MRWIGALLVTCLASVACGSNDVSDMDGSSDPDAFAVDAHVEPGDAAVDGLQDADVWDARAAFDGSATVADGAMDGSTPADAASDGFVAADAAMDAFVCETTEVCWDRIDNDCDGFVDESCGEDLDGDGVLNDADCAPHDSARYPGAPEACCPLGSGTDPECDFDCDGTVTACQACDSDSDGLCPPADCNDSDPRVHSGAPERCNDGIDQDCLGGDLLCPSGADTDADGYIAPSDCREGDASSFPFAPELCDGLDNDCDGTVDEGNPGGGGACGTGAEYCRAGVMVCTHDPVPGPLLTCVGAQIFGPEVCDGLDNDCSGGIDEGCP